MKFKDYFQKELIELRKLYAEAAERNPALAAFLKTKDADIERLLESFAFLSARLRQKLGDDLPEITHGLFSSLWPNYLRPIPATSVIQYQPGSNTMETTVIPKGALVESVPIDDTRWQFSTAYETEILPLKIDEQRLIERMGEIILAVKFTLTNGTLNTLPLSRLRFFFTGEKAVSYSLHFTLLNKVRAIRFVLRDKEKKEHITAVLDLESIKPIGFREEDGLFPYSRNTPMGSRILQEYFCYPDKFLFLEIDGLEAGIHKDKIDKFPDTTEFDLHFILKELPEEYESFRIDNWQLFCTPVVNLFSMNSAPLKLEKQHQEYRVIPDPNFPDHFSVYSVDKITSWIEQGKEDGSYENADSVERLVKNDDAPASYELHIKPSLDGEDVETYISVDAPKTKEVLRFGLTCMNRVRSRTLGIGDICVQAIDSNKSAVPFKNILPVTAASPPPLQKEYLWKIVSAMSLNSIPLSDVAALRAVIATYHFGALHDRAAAKLLERHLHGITNITSVDTDRIFRGIPIRGAQTRITMDKSYFYCEGAMCLFSAVLNEFLAMHATANSFHQLFIESKTGQIYQYPPVLGKMTRR